MNAVSCLANIKTISPRTEGLNKQYSQNTLILTLISVVNIWIARFHRLQGPWCRKKGHSLSDLPLPLGSPLSANWGAWKRYFELRRFLTAKCSPQITSLSTTGGKVSFVVFLVGWFSGVLKGGKVVDVSSKENPQNQGPLKKLVFAISGIYNIWANYYDNS